MKFDQALINLPMCTQKSIDIDKKVPGFTCVWARCKAGSEGSTDFCKKACTADEANDITKRGIECGIERRNWRAAPQCEAGKTYPDGTICRKKVCEPDQNGKTTADTTCALKTCTQV